MDFSQADIVFIGGGADREQMIVKDAMVARKSELSAYVPMAACCSRYAAATNSWVIATPWTMWWSKALGSSIWKPCAARAVLSAMRYSKRYLRCADCRVRKPRRTHDARPRRKAARPRARQDVRQQWRRRFRGRASGNLIGTYLHGPLLPKNPQVADYLIARAFDRRGDALELAPLDDAVELEANRVMAKRLGV